MSRDEHLHPVYGLLMALIPAYYVEITWFRLYLLAASLGWALYETMLWRRHR